MIAASKAYESFRDQIQSSLDFIVLTCHAIPALKVTIRLVDKREMGKLPDPDYFTRPEGHARLKEISTKYKGTLGRFLVISAFSYFESYFEQLLEELCNLHGGSEQFYKKATIRRSKALDTVDDETAMQLNKLREYRKPTKALKYAKYTKELHRKGFTFPSELFSSYGILQLIRLRNPKASSIPTILDEAFGLTLTESEKKGFESIRDLRNKIAHGQRADVGLVDAIKHNEFLRNLAKRIDKHIVGHFFILED